MKVKVVTTIILILLFLNIFCLVGFTITYSKIYDNKIIQSTKNREIILTSTTKPKKETIIINAVGDCTIGYDDNFGYVNSFNQVLEKNGYEHFFSNVKSIFEDDDITIANLEGTFTDSNIKREKAFNFKAPKEYVNVLKHGSIEMVNIANNHTYDYNEEGYLDTIETLNNANIKYFGYENYLTQEIKGIKLGFSGIHCIEDRNCTKKIDKAINYFKEQNVDTIILSFHWGIEKSYKQTEIQTYLAHYSIDNGADLILGHHPHVLQGVELYNNKYIVYSLANFSFGGNKNPADKDTMIFNIKYTYTNNEITKTDIKIYPTSVSSQKNVNDYKPTLLIDDEYNRVMKKIETNSINITLN